MSIDYFSSCKSSSNKNIFGLCDDQTKEREPAYIDENNMHTWIGIVNNPNHKKVDFNAIDNCIDIRRIDDSSKMDKKSDGLLSYEKNLIFVELKERRSGKWFKEGREQITATINRFKIECDISQFKSVKAHVCNSLRPYSHVGQAENIQRFKDDTGYILYGKQQIEIDK